MMVSILKDDRGHLGNNFYLNNFFSGVPEGKKQALNI